MASAELIEGKTSVEAVRRATKKVRPDDLKTTLLACPTEKQSTV